MVETVHDTLQSID
uniref:Uncharacterized protein n=1 Tax=Arundo donax TaxID=35708 RepID=A0A0A9FSV2_ARUDO